MHEWTLCWLSWEEEEGEEMKTTPRGKGIEIPPSQLSTPHSGKRCQISIYRVSAGAVLLGLGQCWDASLSYSTVASCMEKITHFCMLSFLT